MHRSRRWCAVANSCDVPAPVATRAGDVLWTADGLRRHDVAELGRERPSPEWTVGSTAASSAVSLVGRRLARRAPQAGADWDGQLCRAQRWAAGVLAQPGEAAAGKQSSGAPPRRVQSLKRSGGRRQGGLGTAAGQLIQRLRRPQPLVTDESEASPSTRYAIALHVSVDSLVNVLASRGPTATPARPVPVPPEPPLWRGHRVPGTV
jgi:hypothetical protein